MGTLDCVEDEEKICQWKISGSPDGWPGLIGKAIEYGKVKCQVTIADKKFESSSRDIETCVKIAGGQDAKFNISYMRGASSDYSATELFNIAKDNVNYGFNAIDPFARYQGMFAHYVDLKKHDDSGAIFSKLEGFSTCGSFRVFYTNRIDTPGVSWQGNVMLKPGFYGPTLIHEVGHAFCGLRDEYVDPDPPRLESIPQTNCRRTPSSFGAYGGIYKGCTHPDLYRSTNVSIMNAAGLSTKFNVISCGYCLQAIKGGNLDQNFVECADMDTVKPPPNNYTPEGTLGAIDANKITGFAKDNDSPDQPIKVQLFANGPEGQGEDLGQFEANLPYPDQGNHGFSVPLPERFKTTGVTIYVYGVDAQNGALHQLSNSPLTFTPPPVNLYSPVGFLQSVDVNSISGWAYDPDTPQTSIKVQLFANGAKETGENLGTYEANIFRSDVNQAQNITGNHGFSLPLPAKFKTSGVTIYAYAQDSQDHSLHPLANSPFAFTPPPLYATGRFESITKRFPSVYFTGWAYDPRQPAQRLYVFFYAHAPMNTPGSLYLAKVRTNVMRQDINQAYGISGYHGFSYSPGWRYYWSWITGSRIKTGTPIYAYVYDAATKKYYPLDNSPLYWP